jgi:hypothetical protein
MIQTRKEFQDHKFAGLTYFIALFGDSQTILNRDFPLFSSHPKSAGLSVNPCFGRRYLSEKSLFAHQFKLKELAIL